MSSEDIRYARRSALGAAVASAEVIGQLATVEWIELTGDLAKGKSWYNTIGAKRSKPFGPAESS